MKTYTTKNKHTFTLRITQIFFAVVALALFVTQANAGSFKVNPLKLTFSPGTKSTTLDVVNTSTQQITVQIDIKDWSQDATGKDVYAETKDLVFFPKIVTLGVGEKRVVRVGYRGKKNLQQEKPYRLFVEELVDRSQERTALSFALRFSIPIFVQSQRMQAAIQVDEARVDRGKANITLHNAGNQHVLVNSLQMTGLNSKQKELFFREQKGWYVLPGVNNQFTLALTESECSKVDRLEVAARTTVKTVVAHIEKANIHCN